MYKSIGSKGAKEKALKNFNKSLALIIFSLFAIIIFLSSCTYMYTKSNNSFSTLGSNITQEVIELSVQYKKLRNKLRYINRDERNDDLVNYGGLLHTTLIKLGELLGNSSNTRKDIINIMGEPDAVRQEDEKEYLIYFLFVKMKPFKNLSGILHLNNY